MFNPKNFPTLVKELSLVFGLRKARALVKGLRFNGEDSLLDAPLFNAFVWDDELRGFDYWRGINYRTNDQKRRLRDKRLASRRKK